MKRILLMVLRNLWFVPYGWFKLCYTAAHVEKYTEEERYQILKMIDRRANIGGRITPLMPMEWKTSRSRMDSCFFQTIRGYMMCWQYSKSAHVRFR